MDQIHHIRQMFYEQGKNISEISAETGLNWKTVKKYVDMEDFSSPPPVPEKEVTHDSKLDQFRPLIDSWLEEDKKAPRKQRHTAKRIFNRLKAEAEGFSCSYRLVASYVARKKKELRLSRQEGYIPLIHRPGEAQADFGTADFYENGHHYRERKYLVLSFPFSNGGYLQLNYGENTECLLEGLRTIFEHIGGVPTEIWFDNTRTIVTDIIKGGGRSVTERFSRFAEHYRFKPVFMNPESGWEKGSVENKTGYLRRNELVRSPDSQAFRRRTGRSWTPATGTWDANTTTIPKAGSSARSTVRTGRPSSSCLRYALIRTATRAQGRTNTADLRLMTGNTAIRPPRHSPKRRSRSGSHRHPSPPWMQTCTKSSHTGACTATMSRKAWTGCLT